MKNSLKNIALFSISAIITSVLLELYLNGTELSLPSNAQEDKIIGRALKPDANIFLLNEGFYMGSSNKFGYLGKPYPPERNSSHLRIALVGDSFVEGFQVFERDHFMSHLENRLEKIQTRDVEILNFGRSNQDFRAAYTYYLQKVGKFNPDITLLFISELSLTKKDRYIGPELVDINDSLQIDNDFVLTKEFRSKYSRRFLRNFATYTMLLKVSGYIKKGMTMHILFDKFYRDDQPSVHTKTKLSTNAKDSFFNINTKIFRTISEKNKSQKEKIILVVMDELPSYYYSEIAKLNLPVINLLPLFQKMKSLGINPRYWKATKKTGHWNHAAHKAIGSFLSDQLKNFIY